MYVCIIISDSLSIGRKALQKPYRGCPAGINECGVLSLEMDIVFRRILYLN